MDFKKFEPIDWFLVIAVMSLAIIYLIYGIPSIIYDTFKYNGSTDLFSASDILQFYGILLGAAATIIAVRWTILSTQKSAEQDRKNAIVINHRNEGIKACFDLIESCDYGKIIELLNTAKLPEDENDLDIINEKATLYNKFTILMNSIKICHIRWQFIYPEIDENTRNFIDDYPNSNLKFIRDLQNSIKYIEKRFMVDKETMLEFLQYQDKNIAEFTEVLKVLAQEYDCESIWNYEFCENKEDKNIDKIEINQSQNYTYN